MASCHRLSSSRPHGLQRNWKNRGQSGRTHTLADRMKYELGVGRYVSLGAPSRYSLMSQLSPISIEPKDSTLTRHGRNPPKTRIPIRELTSQHFRTNYVNVFFRVNTLGPTLGNRPQHETRRKAADDASMFQKVVSVLYASQK